MSSCNLDHRVIASWFSVEHLGERPANPVQANRWDGERDDSLMTVLEEPAFADWCSSQSPAIDTACWTLAGDSRRECLVARQEVLRLPVTGPICELDSRYLVSVWLSADAGIELDITNELAYDRYQTAVLATSRRLESVPVDLVCKQTGGYPIGCYVRGTGPRCRQFASAMTFWMAPE